MLTFSYKRANREHLKLMSYLRTILEAEDKMLRASESVGDVQEFVPVSRIATSLASGSQLLPVSEPTTSLLLLLPPLLFVDSKGKGPYTAERFGFILRKSEDWSWRKVCNQVLRTLGTREWDRLGKSANLFASSSVPPLIRIDAHLVVCFFSLQKHDV